MPAATRSAAAVGLGTGRRRYRAESGEGDLWASPPSFQPLFPVIKMWGEEVAKSPRELDSCTFNEWFRYALTEASFHCATDTSPCHLRLASTEATRVGICKARNGRRQSQHSRRADNRAHPNRRQWSTCMRPPRWQLSQPILALASHWRSQHRCSAHRMGNRCICTTRTVIGERRATPLTAAHGCRAALNAGVCSAVACAPRCP